MLGEEVATGAKADALEKALLFMINSCIESGLVGKEEMVNKLENIIQDIVRGNLQSRLESI